MAALDIPYTELYVGDRHKTVEYFTGSFGFEESAVSESPDMQSSLLRQGAVRLVVSSGPATEHFLDQHGDGIADIALTCDNVAETAAAAVAAGGRVLPSDRGSIAVSGFGDVRHTLVPTGPGEPADRVWTEGRTATPARDGAAPILSLDHIAVCLSAGTLHETVQYYIDGFGCERFYSEYVEVGEQAMDSIVVRNPSGGMTFTIIEPDPQREPGQIDAFLQRNSGSGVQHLAFLVDDIVAAVRDFRNRGVEFLHTPGTYYEMLADRIPEMADQISSLSDTNVLADCDEWGYLLQLFSRSPHERNTLFYELIQRHGAQGFGSANIRALYEAVERERVASQ
ncbi:4-hydroxyphenylpyruvate dioxygenase [Streptomyces arenae]|uniref:4-hydroxyphenylpyruvate dioxygenase n=1 Tax=Streptomyces arenae TaxID=29301 RepID=UPI00265A69D9|nr:4-hydroxyphenylpyruvate dioxygenase [Streptomyces arenae]MCG7204961.1 4-hydroxyphenylpyruvate dioxygenase [Streptomyces arenae]